MKVMRLSKFIFLFSLIAITLIPGVFATWRYAIDPIQEQQTTFSPTIAEFYYKPESVLPGGTGNTDSVELVGNHLNLVNIIVAHVTYGLNATSKPIIKNLLLKDKDMVYSEQNVQGGNLKHMLLSQNESEKLMFVVVYVSDTHFDAYTFSTYEVSNTTIGNYVTVYKTKLVYENGKWRTDVAFVGKAKLFNPDVKGVSKSIDVSTWVQT